MKIYWMSSWLHQLKVGNLRQTRRRFMVQVSERPESFPVRNDVHEGLRAARHGRYLIFFLHSGEEVQIVRVLHGARDLPRQFE
ncbi:type II toxin-antitoxin system RelE/ParE family toxin [Mangrovicoccus sp. HB161399]|uniref:type II toxin-antitoxin system RelE/ParE family toxin n=1 Tax=Mangrovicoccus sp. HB161399 TaxID=2720392 RepID=UPI0015519BFE|nr:type II toxin-antitoxin system RelE/ParE family toxin [Mangrovicoccus sp. HB161399]